MSNEIQHPQQKQQQEQPLAQKREATQTHSASQRQCPSCGEALSAGDRFCPYCRASLTGGVCPSCGGATEPSWTLCRACKHPLSTGRCSFCGGAVVANEKFCSHCGNPRDGITCEKCGTLNFRSFCYRCNAPLNDMAKEAVAEAQRDPEYQRAVTTAERLVEILELLKNWDDATTATTPEAPELSDDLREQMRELEAMMAAAGVAVPAARETPQPAQPRQRPAGVSLHFKFADRNEALAAFKAKAAEFQQQLDNMLPDAGAAPEVQQNYFAARKIASVVYTKKTVKEAEVVEVHKQIPVHWVCNAYGCEHSDGPTGCADPSKGGKWVYNLTTTTEIAYRDVEVVSRHTEWKEDV
jgi:predicted amidophosphoribosyltransferase